MLFDDYINADRHDLTNEFNLRPLLITRQGKPYETTIQQNVYWATRICEYIGKYPHYREIDECEATSYKTGSKSLSSVSPHAVIRDSTTRHLTCNMQKKVAADR